MRGAQIFTAWKLHFPYLNGRAEPDSAKGSSAHEVLACADCRLAFAAATVGRRQGNPGLQKVVSKRLKQLSHGLKARAGKDCIKARGNVLMLHKRRHSNWLNTC